MKKFSEFSRFGKILFLLNIIVLGSAGILEIIRLNSSQIEEVYFHPSIVEDWAIEDPSILLNGRMYYPPQFSAEYKYPIVLLFHGVGRSLEDNDYLARKLAKSGIIAFAISFRGHGNSNGIFDKNDGTHYNITFGDALGTYRFVHNFSYIDQQRIIAYGISLGGGASVFLALSDLVPKFVVAFPALAYIMGTTLLYLHNSTNPSFNGYIMAGSADECTRCLPEYVEIFTQNNPSIKLTWFMGASHTDSRFWSESIELALTWISETLNISLPSQLELWYGSGYISLTLLIFVCAVDIIALIRMGFKKRALNSKKR